MAKYYGMIGYAEYREIAPDRMVECITEHEAVGDVLRISRKWIGSEHQNDDLEISNRISIVMDPYSAENFSSMRYATYMGAKWIVKSVEIAYPRLILDLGGVYHDQRKTE